MDGSAGLIYLVVLIIAFYLLIIRPQMQRTKQMRELLASLALGDKVVTIGGLHGAIVEMGGSTVTLRVAEDIELTYEKTAIARKDTPTTEASDDTVGVGPEEGES